ncbi:MAG TPA: SRPBCC family protein [Candidatus Thermoplasmatota archaeon]|nr:SRPBCC family protein [Candidatus Thermoplasmatota archaeon]
MHARASVSVRAPRKLVWDIVSNIANAGATVKAIQKLEILHKPESGLVGLKWRETRTMFGKEATEVMWITSAQDQAFYETRAESHGMVYTSRVAVADAPGGGTLLSMDFGGEAQTFGARAMGFVFGVLMKGSVRKALTKDLEDIKAAAEARA